MYASAEKVKRGKGERQIERENYDSAERRIKRSKDYDRRESV